MATRRSVTIGVIGEDRPPLPEYAAVEEALQHAADALGTHVQVRRLPTHLLREPVDEQLEALDALWCGPCGPYDDMEGALRAIRFARERRRPFLGTCAGFQHAAIEFARSVLGLHEADHAEVNPAAVCALVAPLPEPIIDRSAAVMLDPGSRVAQYYRRTVVAERYRCHFGLSPEFLSPLHRSGLRVTGVGEDGMASVIEDPSHPFFVATLFMPERSSWRARPHPLVAAYVQATMVA